MTPFAYECYADHDLFVVLVGELGLPLVGKHLGGQGEVIRLVVVERKVKIGMVDEDPNRSHHGARDRMKLVRETEFAQLRESNGHYLIVLKPELEERFLSSMKRLGLTSKLGARANEIRAELGDPKTPSHQVFRQELKLLHARSTQDKTATLMSSLDEFLRPLT